MLSLLGIDFLRINFVRVYFMRFQRIHFEIPSSSKRAEEK